MEGMSEEKKGLVQLLSDSLWRGAGEKAGFNVDNGWADENCTLIQTTEAKGHRVPSSSHTWMQELLKPFPFMGRGLCSWSEHRETRWSPQD